MVMGTVTWAGMAIITDGAEAEGIITDGDTIGDDLKPMILRSGPIWRPLRKGEWPGWRVADASIVWPRAQVDSDYFIAS